MCGITGWVHFNRDLRTQVPVVEKMTKTLSKRGPDDDNVWIEAHAVFGHRRLTVVDPIGGKQPMTKIHQDNRYTLCYNGELYNTEDLRKELLQKRLYLFWTLRYRSITDFLYRMERAVCGVFQWDFRLCHLG